jgi:hypothetical protein
MRAECAQTHRQRQGRAGGDHGLHRNPPFAPAMSLDSSIAEDIDVAGESIQRVRPEEAFRRGRTARPSISRVRLRPTPQSTRAQAGDTRADRQAAARARQQQSSPCRSAIYLTDMADFAAMNGECGRLSPGATAGARRCRQARATRYRSKSRRSPPAKETPMAASSASSAEMVSAALALACALPRSAPMRRR